MGGPVWKKINVLGSREVNGLDVAGYGQSGPEKSWTVPSLMYAAEIITIWFASWIFGRIVSLQPDTDIQKLLSNGTWIRISEMLLSIFRGFRLLEKVAHCTIIHLLSSEASFQPSVPWLPVCLWCNICSIVQSHSHSNQCWTWSGFRIAIQPDSAIQNRIRIGLDFEKNSTGSDMDIQTALITAV